MMMSELVLAIFGAGWRRALVYRRKKTQNEKMKLKKASVVETSVST